MKSTIEMATVFCIGETVLDIIFNDGQPVSATPGGSALNSAVSLGRAGLKVEFVSEYGKDQPGKIIDDFLKQNNVGTHFIRRYDDGKTALALAFLDKKRNASYSFHTLYPRIRMKDPLPTVKKGDVILFGSIYSISPGIRGKIVSWVKKARAKGTLIIYDPNFRKSHIHTLETTRSWIIENISIADIVRGSDEDFFTVFGLQKPDDVRITLSSFGCENVIITRNSKSVIAWFNDKKTSVNIPVVKPLASTIGAGDSYNAGIIYALVGLGLTEAGSDHLTPENIRAMIGSGISFAADVCKSLENYISTGFSKTLRS